VVPVPADLGVHPDRAGLREQLQLAVQRRARDVRLRPELLRRRWPVEVAEQLSAVTVVQRVEDVLACRLDDCPFLGREVAVDDGVGVSSSQSRVGRPRSPVGSPRA
jgi:hypothetical protein